jgi:hypothetical protein
VLANFGEEIGAMTALVDRALTLNPSFSRGWFLGGVLRLWAGQPDLAIEHAETALRLSPRERMGTPLSLIGEAHFFKREFAEAASKLLQSVQENPGYPHSYRVLAACYAQMGRLRWAQAIIGRLRVPPLCAERRTAPAPADRRLFLSDRAGGGRARDDRDRPPDRAVRIARGVPPSSAPDGDKIGCRTDQAVTLSGTPAGLVFVKWKNWPNFCWTYRR